GGQRRGAEGRRVLRIGGNENVVSEVEVRPQTDVVFLGDEGVVVHEDTGRCDAHLQRPAHPRVLHVADEVGRPAEYRLRAEAAGRGVRAAVFEHPDVAGTAVRLDTVVAHLADVVVVDVDRYRQAFLVPLRST